MDSTNVSSAAEFHPVVLPRADAKWDRERREFARLLPSLLESHRGKFVAIHDGRVVGEGADQIEVAMRAYSEFGYVPIYVGLVNEVSPTVVQFKSPRAALPDRT
jgi:hypothetical protein